MLTRLTSHTLAPFSYFKTKCLVIDQHNYSSLQDLYTHLSQF